MNFKLISALALLSVVAAQSTTSTPSDTDSMAVPSATPSGAPGAEIPSCLTDCVSQSGCDMTDIECVCVTNLTAITTCATTNCSPADLATAAQLQSTLCASGGMSGAMSSTPTVTGSATTNAGNSTSLSASTPSSAPPSLTRTTSSATLSTRPLSSGTTSSTSPPAATSTNAAPQNIVAQGVWVMAASLIGLAVAA